MFISTLDLFKIGIGPSSSHTYGPMLAAFKFREALVEHCSFRDYGVVSLKCILYGSLAHTGKGHATDRAVMLGLNGYKPEDLASKHVPELIESLPLEQSLENSLVLSFDPTKDLVFDTNPVQIAHPNTLKLSACNSEGRLLLEEIYHSIGGGFVVPEKEFDSVTAPLRFVGIDTHPYPFSDARSMLNMANQSGNSIAQMKRSNEYYAGNEQSELDHQLDRIWKAMQSCVEAGLNHDGVLPGAIKLERRAKLLYDKVKDQKELSPSMEQELLCVYAIAVNEENAAGHAVVTAPTNGAAGVIPAVLYHYMENVEENVDDHREFLLTAAAIGGLIKHNSSISGAEVGCQGEVGAAAAMAAAGLCAVKGGSPEQVENAAEIALEHHLGMTCDPVQGLVQVPCIERNAFGAVKAYTASSLALMGSGQHMMPLDKCIDAMRETGREMSDKYKETSLGGLAKSWTEC